ncbi:F-box domain-containing protein [Mycena kentingensis (nom. inval.)]|nr:F-box domain-containing protein [Mycena kentingensis (nom. inval.)]
MALPLNHGWEDLSLPEAEVARDLELVSTWLERSGAYPLTIDLESRGGIHTSIMSALLAHCHRWEFVRITVAYTCDPETTPLPNLENLQNVPMLRHIEVQVYQNEGWYQTHPGEVMNDDILIPRDWMLPHAPALRSAILWSSKESRDLLPWHQLTALVIGCADALKCPAILRLTPLLRYCELAFNYADFPVPSSDSLGGDLHLPYLEHLTLDTWEQSCTCETAFPHLFVAPRLSSLRILEEYFRPNPVRQLGTFVDKAGCASTLKKVLITGNTFTRQRKFRRRFPHVSFSFEYGSEWCNIKEAERARSFLRAFV